MKGKKRCVVLVLDGLGVGAMEDVALLRPQDRGAHTLKHIIEAVPGINIPHFLSSGIISYFCHETWNPHTFQDFSVLMGKLKLRHFGADSYLGHQELMGTRPKAPIRQFVRFVQRDIVRHLEKYGVKSVFNGQFIDVEGEMAVADNIETDYGLNINVIGSLDHANFRDIEQVGRLVRQVVHVGRVITMGGMGVSRDTYKKCFEIVCRDTYTAWGINVPKLNIYNAAYRVIHMGYGIDPTVQIPSILAAYHIPVFLIGKTADVITAPRAVSLPEVQTEQIQRRIYSVLQAKQSGFIFANVQQTDLAGHTQDVHAYAHQLELVDEMIFEILNTLGDTDMFMIVGDHGNDPTIGHSNHTREMTPCIIFSKHMRPTDFGVRQTLADVGATVADYFSVPHPQSGVPIFRS